MSFEGYYQILCENKHYQKRGCYETEVFKCGRLVDGSPCDAKTTWENLIDETNGSGLEQEVRIVRITNAITKRCDLGHDHIWSSATFAAMTMGPLGLLAEQADD